MKPESIDNIEKICADNAKAIVAGRQELLHCFHLAKNNGYLKEFIFAINKELFSIIIEKYDLDNEGLDTFQRLKSRIENHCDASSPDYLDILYDELIFLDYRQFVMGNEIKSLHYAINDYLKEIDGINYYKKYDSIKAKNFREMINDAKTYRDNKRKENPYGIIDGSDLNEWAKKANKPILNFFYRNSLKRAYQSTKTSDIDDIFCFDFNMPKVEYNPNFPGSCLYESYSMNYEWLEAVGKVIGIKEVERLITVMNERNYHKKK
jgi:hypothetical protein